MPDVPLPMKLMMTLVYTPMMLLLGAKWQTLATITELDAPRKIAWEARAPKRKGDMMRARWVLALNQESEGTRVTEHFEFMPQMRFPGAPPVKMVEQEVGRNLAKLKQLAEHGS
jgi:hypothetical protein